MAFLKETREHLNTEIDRYARANVVKKLRKMDVDPDDIAAEELEELVEKEREILKHDTKKVGLGIGIGIALSLLTGI